MNRNVMVRAWEIAREGQKRHGGKVTEYLGEALRMAWKQIKSAAKMSMQEVRKKLSYYYEVYGFDVSVRIWEKGSKRRIYVNKNFGGTVGYLEFDQNDNMIGGSAATADMQAAKIQGIYKELEYLKAIQERFVA